MKAVRSICAPLGDRLERMSERELRKLIRDAFESVRERFGDEELAASALERISLSLPLGGEIGQAAARRSEECDEKYSALEEANAPDDQVQEMFRRARFYYAVSELAGARTIDWRVADSVLYELAYSTEDQDAFLWALERSR